MHHAPGCTGATASAGRADGAGTAARLISHKAAANRTDALKAQEIAENGFEASGQKLTVDPRAAAELRLPESPLI
jgi:hypothetical protein